MVIKLFVIQCRHRCYYLLDHFNYIDVPAVVFTALIIPFRIAGYKTQWIFVSLSYLFNGLRAFKYASVNQWVLHSPIIHYIIELCKTHCVQLYRGQEPCPQRFLHVEDSLKLLLMLVKPLHAWIVKLGIIGDRALVLCIEPGLYLSQRLAILRIAIGYSYIHQLKARSFNRGM